MASCAVDTVNSCKLHLHFLYFSHLADASSREAITFLMFLQQTTTYFNTLTQPTTSSRGHMTTLHTFHQKQDGRNRSQFSQATLKRILDKLKQLIFCC